MIKNIPEGLCVGSAKSRFSKSLQKDIAIGFALICIEILINLLSSCVLDILLDLLEFNMTC